MVLCFMIEKYVLKSVRVSHPVEEEDLKEAVAEGPKAVEAEDQMVEDEVKDRIENGRLSEKEKCLAKEKRKKLTLDVIHGRTINPVRKGRLLKSKVQAAPAGKISSNLAGKKTHPLSLYPVIKPVSRHGDHQHINKTKHIIFQSSNLLKSSNHSFINSSIHQFINSSIHQFINSSID
jgi:hypothetical protein